MKLPGFHIEPSPGCGRSNAQRSLEIIGYVNVYNAKLLAAVMVLCSLIYHGLLHLHNGSKTCKWLLSDGYFHGPDSWQPYGCMMHKYTESDSANCMRYVSYWGGRSHIVFLGDSRIRQVYYEFVNKFHAEPQEATKKHADMHYRDEKLNLKVDFLWQPVLNEAMMEVYNGWAELPRKQRPGLVITGSATWTIKLSNASETALSEYRASLESLLPLFDAVKNETRILWMLQDPVVEQKLYEVRAMITNTELDKYNRVALTTLRHSAVELWGSSRLVAKGYTEQSEDGLHASPGALEWYVQMLLNMYCNDHMNFHDGTCCSTQEPLSAIQIATAAVFGASITAFLLVALWRRRPALCRPEIGVDLPPRTSSSVDTSPTQSPCYELVSCLSRMGVILAFTFLCDRTSFFMKENKSYSHLNFILPFVYFTVLGLFFTETCDQNEVLGRQQSDEWKGWMQLIILIYHMTGASQVLPVYMLVRVLISSYLFLLGYGHFHYFWTKADFSVFRLCKVLFRTNLLVILLCFVMNRPYQFYHFVPLITFPFLIIYVTMAIWPRVTAATAEANKIHYLYLILKLAAVAVVLTLLYSSEVFFEKVFLSRPFKALFVTSDDSIHQWRFRWQLDRYSALQGVLFSLGIFLVRRHNLLGESPPRMVTWLLGGLSLAGLASYGALVGFAKSKQECIELHPYISFIPVVSYALLRNLHPGMRARYSAFFAWFGSITLELFISQYHIWLAADTHGVLVLVPNNPAMNVIVTSFIFVCTAHEIHALTTTLTEYAVPDDWKRLLRNVVCFVTILLSLAIMHGVFVM